MSEEKNNVLSFGPIETPEENPEPAESKNMEEVNVLSVAEESAPPMLPEEGSVHTSQETEEVQKQTPENANETALSFGSIVLEEPKEYKPEITEDIGQANSAQQNTAESEQVASNTTATDNAETITPENQQQSPLSEQSADSQGHMTNEKNPFSEIFQEEENILPSHADTPILSQDERGEKSIPTSDSTEIIPEKQDAEGILPEVVQKDFENESVKEKKGELVSNIIQSVSASKEKINEEESILGEDFSEQLETPEEKEKHQKQEKRKMAFLAVSRFLLIISLLVPASSMLVFSTILQPGSFIADKIDAKNYGNILEKAQDQNAQKEEHLNKIKKEIIDVNAQIKSLENNPIIAQIKANRVDFLDVMLQIQNITLDSLDLTSELNQTIQMLVFNSYSGSADNRGNVKINISGSVRNPRKMTFTSLTKLMETINESKYFDGAVIRSFSKSDDAEGGATSSFAFNLDYFPNPEDETLLSDNKK
jgi:hypothetical protein